MTFSAYDSNGYLGDVASIGGWTAFAKWAGDRSGALTSLVRTGASENLSRLIAEMGVLYAPDPDVESVRKGLLALAQKAQEILIVSEGEG